MDKHGIDFLKLRAARRSLGAVLTARMEIATRLKAAGVVARNVGLILNCDEWMVRYYSNPNHRKRKRRRDLDRYYIKTSPRNHIERMTAAGPEVESVI
jgi:hypothetical protein